MADYKEWIPFSGLILREWFDINGEGAGVKMGSEAVGEASGADPLVWQELGTPDWGLENSEGQGAGLGSHARWGGVGSSTQTLSRGWQLRKLMESFLRRPEWAGGPGSL